MKILLKINSISSKFYLQHFILISDKVLEELKLLADFLNLSLRKAGLHTLSSSNEHVEDSVDSQFTKHDLLGIPYTLVIKDNTLSNGIAGLRSRDTTLQVWCLIQQLKLYLQFHYYCRSKIY